MTSPSRSRDAIDIVITWVDGSDPSHAARLAAAARKVRGWSLAIPGGVSPTRFSDSGELEMCIRAIRTHCPWASTIFLVTDGQTPLFLAGTKAGDYGVRIVDHREIFRGFEWAVPTFNSQTIECMLHRIPGLSDRYVYFNDDVIVLRATSEEDFFVGDKVVLRGEWRPLPRFGRMRLLASWVANHVHDKIFRKVRSMAVLAQYRAAELAGMTAHFFQAPHVPHPVRKATLAAFFGEKPEELARNISFPFRDMSQFAPIPLSNHLEILRKNAVEVSTGERSGDCLLICFNRDGQGTIMRKIQALESTPRKFLCLQGFEKATPAQRKRIVDAISQCGS